MSIKMNIGKWLLRTALNLLPVLWLSLLPVHANTQELKLFVLNRGENNILVTASNAPGQSVNEAYSENISAPFDFLFDPVNSNLIWSNSFPGQVYQSQTIAGGTAGVFPSEVGLPVDLEYDPMNKKIYWVDNQFGKLYRCNPDGTEVTPLFQDTIGNLAAIAIFPALDLLFFSSIDSSKIWVSHIDGSDRKSFVDQDLGTPVRLLADTVNHVLYWADDSQNSIEKIHVDGSGRSVFYQGLDGEYPFGLYLDYANHRLLWTDYGKDQMMASSLDETDQAYSILTGLNDPVAVLFLPDMGGRPRDGAETNVRQVNEVLVAVFPNPADNSLNLRCTPETANLESISIMNSTGANIFTSKPFQNAVKIDVSIFPPGSYSYSVVAAGKVLTGHFTIIH